MNHRVLARENLIRKNYIQISAFPHSSVGKGFFIPVLHDSNIL
jgi:hypothetical protein